MARRGKPSIAERETAESAWADFQYAKRTRLNYDLAWHVFYQQYGGNADIFYDEPSETRGAQIYTVPRRGSRSQRLRVLNVAGHAIDIITAKRMRVRPVPNCIPTSSAQGKILAARASRDLLRHWWRSNGVNTIRRELFLDAHILGNGFMGVQFDHNLGPFVDEDQMVPCTRCQGTALDPEAWEMKNEGMLPQRVPSRCSQCAGLGRILGKTTRRPLGDVDFQLIRPWEIYPDPAANTIQDARHIFRAFRVHPREVASRFPWLSDEEVKSSANLEEGESTFAKHAREYRYESRDEYAWIVEKHMPPLPGTEEPRIVILAGDRIAWPRKEDKEGVKQGWVKRKERTGRIPIYHFRTRANPENFWQNGFLKDMLSSSDTVNRGRDIQHRHLLQMVNSKWFAERGSIKADALTTDVGEVVEYEPTSQRPVSDRPAPLADFAERLIERERNNVYEIAGVHELDRGIAPKNIEAAEALELLIEQSGQMLGPIIAEDNEQFGRMFFAGLCTAKANYKADEQRFALVGGEGSELEAKALDGAAISTELVVHVETGSALNDNLSLKRNWLMQMYKDGLMTDKREVMQAMEFGGGDADYTDDRRLQEAAAMAENEKVQKGEPHEMTSGVDDHEIHASIHRRAALRAKIDGDMKMYQAMAQAVIEHMQQLQPPPAPPPPAGGAPAPPQGGVPFDAMPGDRA